MFTGIIEATGRITRVEPRNKGVRLTIASDALDFGDVAIGDSIAVNGACLTVISLGGGSFTVDVSQESLNCTVGLGAVGEVNLEKAMRLSDRLGGHLVSGHVDGVGEVARFEPVGESHLLVIRPPRTLLRYIAPKGSVTVNGVSLTVNEVANGEFSINLIPHTLAVTTLKYLKAGAKVNLEADMLARYVDRLLHPEPDQTGRAA
jgi:riboflavin synthase